MSDSTDGYGVWALGRFWTPYCPPDTTPEAAAAQHKSWMAFTGEERLTIWLKRIHAMNEYRRQQIREKYPDADEARRERIYLEQTYRGEFSEEYLDGYETFLRARDAAPGETAE